MTNADHIMIGLMIGAAGVLWRVGREGLEQYQTLSKSRHEINQATAETESEKAEVEEEMSHLRDSLDESVKELERLKLEHDELMRSKE